MLFVSVLINDPVISPKANSRSYFATSRSSALSLWIQWSLRALFDLEDDVRVRERDAFLRRSGRCVNYDDYVELVSNEQLVENSALFSENSFFARYSPMHGTPVGLSSENAAKFVVTTALGDPLFDEGREFSKNITESGAKVTTLESKSSHTMGIYCDRNFRKKLVETWRQAMFDNGK